MKTLSLSDVGKGRCHISVTEDYLFFETKSIGQIIVFKRDGLIAFTNLRDNISQALISFAEKVFSEKLREMISLDWSIPNPEEMIRLSDAKVLKSFLMEFPQIFLNLCFPYSPYYILTEEYLRMLKTISKIKKISFRKFHLQLDRKFHLQLDWCCFLFSSDFKFQENNIDIDFCSLYKYLKLSRGVFFTKKKVRIIPIPTKIKEPVIAAPHWILSFVRPRFIETIFSEVNRSLLEEF